MTTNLRPIPRFTLMLSGEDTADLSTDPQHAPDTPPKGLPQERFLIGEKLAIAPIWLLGQSDLPVDPHQVIACLQPVHLHATRDHLILMAQSQIDLTAKESTQLCNLVLPYIEEEFRHTLLFQGQHAWFIPAGPFASLATHSIDQAHGRNIDWWMPRDTHEEGIAKLWRKLQNEIQMLWHIDAVNEARARSGLPSINSLWISGIGKLQDVQTPDCLQNTSCLYGNHPLLKGLAKYLGIAHQAEIAFPELIHAEHRGNIFAWLDKPQDIWQDLSQALINQAISELEIIDFPAGKARHRLITVRDLHRKSWAFWKKPERLSWKEIISES